jgi:hypothetical protein
MTAMGMNLHFCDLCNESIPQADLDNGRAKRRGERLICVACEGAMSPPMERTGERPLFVPPAPAAVLAPPVHTHTTSSSPALAVALAFSSVALLVAVGAGAYLFWQLDQRTVELQSELRDVARAAPEAARTVSAALGEEVGARERELAQARSELSRLGERMQELERGERAGADVAGRIDELESRLERVDDLARTLEHQAGAVDQLTDLVTELSARRPGDTSTSRTPEDLTAATEDEPPQDGATGEPEAVAPQPPAPAKAPGWEGWIADLASPDSGTRWQAVQSLGGTRDPAVVPHLVPMLDDTDIFVRMAACRHLGDIGAVEAIPGLIDALEDEEASVREAALVSLRALSGQSIPFDPLARDGDRAKRVRAWRDWWDEASKDLLPPPRGGETKG